MVSLRRSNWILKTILLKKRLLIVNNLIHLLMANNSCTFSGNKRNAYSEMLALTQKTVEQ